MEAKILSFELTDPQKSAESTFPFFSHNCQGITVAGDYPSTFKIRFYNTVAVIGKMRTQRLRKQKQFMAIRWGFAVMNSDGLLPGKPMNLVEFEFEGKTYPFGTKLFYIKDIHYGFEICEALGEAILRPDTALRTQSRSKYLIQVLAICGWE